MILKIFKEFFMESITNYSDSTLPVDLNVFWKDSSILGKAVRNSGKASFIFMQNYFKDHISNALAKFANARQNGSLIFWKSAEMAVDTYGNDLAIPLCGAMLSMKRSGMKISEESLSYISGVMCGMASRETLEKNIIAHVSAGKKYLP